MMRHDEEKSYAAVGVPWQQRQQSQHVTWRRKTERRAREANYSGTEVNKPAEIDQQQDILDILDFE